MCRLIGFVSPSPTTLREVVGPAQCELFQRLSRVHADGWGTAWLGESGDLESGRVATPAGGDERFTEVLTQTPTRARLVHLRMATDRMAVRLENTHPFVADGIALAHNGSIVPREPLLDGLGADALAGVHGDTDSELYLAWIREEVRGGLGVAAAANRVVSRLQRRFPRASFNALILTATELIVVHASSTAFVPIDHFAGRGIREADLPLEHLEAYYELSYLSRPDGTVVFSSTGIDRQGWTPLPHDSVTSVDIASLTMTTRPLGS